MAESLPPLRFEEFPKTRTTRRTKKKIKMTKRDTGTMRTRKVKRTKTNEKGIRCNIARQVGKYSPCRSISRVNDKGYEAFLTRCSRERYFSLISSID